MSGVGTHPSHAVLLVERCGNTQIPLSGAHCMFLPQLSSKCSSTQRHVLARLHWRYVLLCVPILVLL